MLFALNSFGFADGRGEVREKDWVHNRKADRLKYRRKHITIAGVYDEIGMFQSQYADLKEMKGLGNDNKTVAKCSVSISPRAFSNEN